jgi:hypothetical protein
MMSVGDDAGLPEAVCHVHHLDLITDPVSTVEGVYRHFDMEFSPRTASKIGMLVAAHPRGGYGARSYAFKDHGLDEAQERAKFRPYMVRFGVTPEAAPRGRISPAPVDRLQAGTQRLPS